MRLTLLALIIFAFLLPGFTQSIVINEIMSSNETTIVDEDGDYSDWIELYNYSNEPVLLHNIYLSDDTSNLFKWCLPDTILSPTGFLMIFASGKDRIEGPWFHTNFKIKFEGEYVLLSNSEDIIDQLLPVIIETDISYGRKPDGNAQFLFFEFPSPGISNNYSNSLYFSHERGYYTEPFKLYISSDNNQDIIYYTVDGTVPTINSLSFQDSILIDYTYNLPNTISEIPTTPDSSHLDNYPWQSPNGLVDKANIIRARSFCDTIPSSKVYSFSYFVDSSIFSKYPYPVISLITEPLNLFDQDTGIYIPGVYWELSDPWWTGNYYQKGIEWERDMHIEYFEQSGEPGFYQDAGVRIHGKQTRRRPQKSFRFYAREQYKNKNFNYQLLPHKPITEFKNFLLSTTYGCWHGTVFKDVMTNNIIKNFGFDYIDYRLVVVFINGEYWGIQTIRDYYNEDYLSQVYDIPKDSIDLLENRKGVISGSNDSYSQLVDFISLNDLSIQENFEYVNAQIDINNFINYQIAEIFFNNYDWPSSNIKFWKSGELDNLWRWIFFDIDAGYGVYNYNMIEHATLEGGPQWPNPDWSTLFLRKLLKNDEFKDLFAEKFAYYLNTTFQADSILEKIQFFETNYDLEIDRHMYRWNFPESKEAWESSIGWALQDFAIKRPCAISEHLIEYLELDEFGFNCDTAVQPEDQYKAQVIVLPNPNNGNFEIEFAKSISKTVFIKLYNVHGSAVFSRIYTPIDVQDNFISFNLNYLRKGLYLIKIHYDNVTYFEKIIIR
ncbi:MAG: CotH kinase family protein [Bacteroidales bacterium]|nr:CotH kinase family protein [Bacteroidales bacterium]